ncbi:MAG: NigD-like C-terminal domain-containing protein [Bacteroidaceae bacterium]
MNKISLSLAVFLLGISFLLQSCTQGDSYSLNTSITSMATVEKTQGTVYPYFLLDNGKTVWISIPMLSFQQLTPGQRVIGNFTLLNSQKDGFDYFARLNGYSLVLTKEIINLDLTNQTAIGNNPINFRAMWVGSHYLNVEFYVNAPNLLKQSINLVINRLVAPYDDGYAHFELRYNNLGNTTTPLVPGIISFDLGAFAPGNQGFKGLKILIKSIKNGLQEIVIGYPVKGSDGEEVNLGDEYVEQIL